jgi:hypothetical protein
MTDWHKNVWPRYPLVRKRTVPCDKEAGFIQTGGTCWFQAALNALILSDGGYRLCVEAVGRLILESDKEELQAVVNELNFLRDSLHRANAVIDNNGFARSESQRNRPKRLVSDRHVVAAVVLLMVIRHEESKYYGDVVRSLMGIPAGVGATVRFLIRETDEQPIKLRIGASGNYTTVAYVRLFTALGLANTGFVGLRQRWKWPSDAIDEIAVVTEVRRAIEQKQSDQLKRLKKASFGVVDNAVLYSETHIMAAITCGGARFIVDSQAHDNKLTPVDWLTNDITVNNTKFLLGTCIAIRPERLRPTDAMLAAINARLKSFDLPEIRLPAHSGPRLHLELALAPFKEKAAEQVCKLAEAFPTAPSELGGDAQILQCCFTLIDECWANNEWWDKQIKKIQLANAPLLMTRLMFRVPLYGARDPVMEGHPHTFVWNAIGEGGVVIEDGAAYCVGVKDIEQAIKDLHLNPKKIRILKYDIRPGTPPILAACLLAVRFHTFRSLSDEKAQETHTRNCVDVGCGRGPELMTNSEQIGLIFFLGALLSDAWRTHRIPTASTPASTLEAVAKSDKLPSIARTHRSNVGTKASTKASTIEAVAKSDKLPSITRPPSTRPPITRPPNTRPPNTRPPNTRPPSTRPPNTRLPNTRPPNARPPSTRPPNTRPPNTRLPNTRPPNTRPPNARAPNARTQARTTPSNARAQAADRRSDIPGLRPQTAQPAQTARQSRQPRPAAPTQRPVGRGGVLGALKQTAIGLAYKYYKYKAARAKPPLAQ